MGGEEQGSIILQNLESTPGVRNPSAWIQKSIGNAAKEGGVAPKDIGVRFHAAPPVYAPPVYHPPPVYQPPRPVYSPPAPAYMPRGAPPAASRGPAGPASSFRRAGVDL